MAVGLLGEKLSQRETIGIVVTVTGLAGLLWLRRRDKSVDFSKVSGNVLSVGIGFALLSALGQALGVVLTRQVMKDVNVFTGSVLRILPAVLLLSILGYIVGQRRARKNIDLPRSDKDGIRTILANRKAALAITLAAFFGTFLGIILMTAGVKYTKAGIAAALSSSYPIFIIPIARFVLKEHVTWPMIIMTLISFAGMGYMFL
jgi:drug/metabolite transporter (DMT)-like permease